MVSFDPTPDKFSKGKVWNTSPNDPCWKENFEGEVKFNSNIVSEKYIVGQQHGKRGEDKNGWPIHYYMRIICNPSNNTSVWEDPGQTGKGMIEGGYVSIEMVFHIIKADNILSDYNGINTDDELTKSFQLFREGVNKAWNNRFKLIITDHQNKCDPIELPILFALTAVIDETGKIPETDESAPTKSLKQGSLYDMNLTLQPNLPNFQDQVEQGQQNKQNPIKILYNRENEKWHYLVIRNSFKGLYFPDGTPQRSHTDGTAMYLPKIPRNVFDPKDHPKLNSAEKLYRKQHGDIEGTEQLLMLFAHEFGHMLGLPDEYSGDDKFYKRVQYYKPDGTLDSHKVDAPPIKDRSVQDSSMMSSNFLEFPLRLGWAFGIGAQILLDGKSKKGRYSCDIKLNNSK